MPGINQTVTSPFANINPGYNISPIPQNSNQNQEIIAIEYSAPTADIGFVPVQQQVAENSLSQPSQSVVHSEDDHGQQRPVPIFNDPPNLPFPNPDHLQHISNNPSNTAPPYMHVPQPQAPILVHQAPVVPPYTVPQPLLDAQL